MPTIFRCLSLRITMNPRGNEHNPPHVHAYYKDDLAVIDITTSVITKGYIPNDQFLIAKRFIDENRDLLLKIWEEDPQNFDCF